MDKKVCKHLICKQRNGNTECIKQNFSKIQKAPVGIGRDTADLNDMLISRSTYLNNFNKQKKISVSDADYIFQNRKEYNNQNNKDKRNIFQSEIVYDHDDKNNDNKINTQKSQNFYQDDSRMFVYYQKPSQNLKRFAIDNEDVDVLKYLTFRLKKVLSKKLIQFFQQFLQRHIIENQIMKSQVPEEKQINESEENNFVSIKGIKIPVENINNKEQNIDYFDLYDNNPSNENDVLLENQKFKNTVTNLNEELKKVKMSLKNNEQQWSQSKEENIKDNDVSEFDDKSYFDKLDQEAPTDYSIIDKSKVNSIITENIPKIDLQSYLEKQKEKEEGKLDRQRALNNRRSSRQQVIKKSSQQESEKDIKPTKRFSFIQNIQQGFQRNKRLSESGIMMQQQEELKKLEDNEPLDELDELLNYKKVLTEEEEEFFTEFAPKKIDDEFQKELNKSSDDLFSPKRYQATQDFSDEDEDYFHKELKENLFHETLEEHDYRVSGGQREIKIEFNNNKNLSLSGDEDNQQNFQTQQNGTDRPSGFIQSKRFTLGKLDETINQIRKASLKNEQELFKQQLAHELIENIIKKSISQMYQEKQQQFENAQKSILLSKINDDNTQILNNIAKKNSMKLIKNLILEKQNQIIAYNIMQQDTQQRASLKINSQGKENISQNNIQQILQASTQNEQQTNLKEDTKQQQDLKVVKEDEQSQTSNSDDSSVDSEEDIVNRQIQKSISDQIHKQLLKQFEDNRRYSNLAKKSLAELYSSEIDNILDEQNKKEQVKEQKKRMSVFINEEYNILQNSVRDILNDEKIEKEKQRRFSELVNENLESARKTVMQQIDDEQQTELENLVNSNLQLVRNSVHELIRKEIKDQKQAKKLDEAVDEKFNDIIEDEIQRQISKSIQEDLEQQIQEKRKLSQVANQRLSDIYDSQMENYFDEIQQEELDDFVNKNLEFAKSSVLDVIYEEEEDKKISDMIEDNLNYVRFSVQQILDDEVKDQKKKKRISKMIQDDLKQMYLKEVQKQVNTEIVKSMCEQDIKLRQSTQGKLPSEIQEQETNQQIKKDQQARDSLNDAAEKIKKILNLEITDDDEQRRLSLMVQDNLEHIKKFSIKQNKKDEKERRRISTVVSQNLEQIVNREIQKSINTQIQIDMMKQAEQERRNSLIAKKTLNEIVNKEIQRQINQDIINSMTQKELEEYELDDMVNNNLESLKEIQIRKTIDKGQLKQDVQNQIESKDIDSKDKRRLSLIVDQNFEEMVQAGIRHTLTKQRISMIEEKDVENQEEKKQTNFQTQRNSLATIPSQEIQPKTSKNEKIMKKRSSFMKKDFQYEIIDDKISQIPKQFEEIQEEPICRKKTTIADEKFIAKKSFLDTLDNDIPVTRPKLNSVIMHKKSTVNKTDLRERQESMVRPKMNSIIMHKKSTNVNLNVNENEAFVRPKMNSIIMHKKSTHVNLNTNVNENEAFIRPKMNSIVMHQKQSLYRPSIIDEQKVRPKMNSIVIHKKSILQKPNTEQEENFVRPKLNSIVMNQRPTLSRQTITQDNNMVRPKINSIIIHKKSTVVKKPLLEENEAFVRPKLNSIVMNQRPTVSRQTINKDIEMVRPKINSIVMNKKSTIARPSLNEEVQNQRPKLNSINFPKKSVVSNSSNDIERLRNDSINTSVKQTLRNMTNYNIQPIIEEEQDVDLKLCQKNIRKITKKLLKDQMIEMKNAMIDHIMDQPRKKSNKRQSLNFDQFLKRNSKVNNIRFSVNPLFQYQQIQDEIIEEKSQKSEKLENKKQSEPEQNLQVQILSINNIQKLIDVNVNRIKEQNQQNIPKNKTQLVTVDTFENLDQDIATKNRNDIFQSHEPPIYDNDDKPQAKKQTIDIKASGFQYDNDIIEEEDNSISWMNQQQKSEKNNSLSTSSNRRMSTQVRKKDSSNYYIQSVHIENVDNEPVIRKTTFDHRSSKQSDHLTKQNSIGELNEQEEEINELVPKKISKQNSRGNFFKKTSNQFENYSFHSVVFFDEQQSPDLGTHGFKSQLALNKKKTIKRKNTIENYDKWKKYIQDYNVRMMEKMNRAFNKNQDAKQSAVLIDELMEQKIDYDYLIFCLNFTPSQIERIRKVQLYYRNRLNKKIFEKIKEGQKIFQRETNLIQIRKTNLF